MIILLFSCRKTELPRCTTCTTQIMHWSNPGQVINIKSFEVCDESIAGHDDSWGYIMMSGQMFVTYTKCDPLLKIN